MFEKYGQFILLLCNSSKLIVNVYKTTLFYMSFQRLRDLISCCSHIHFHVLMLNQHASNYSVDGKEKVAVLRNKCRSRKHRFCSSSINNHLVTSYCKGDGSYSPLTLSERSNSTFWRITNLTLP